MSLHSAVLATPQAARVCATLCPFCRSRQGHSIAQLQLLRTNLTHPRKEKLGSPYPKTHTHTHDLSHAIKGLLIQCFSLLVV